MRKTRKAALDVLAKSAETYNCWSILDEAVTCGEKDGFTREYIEGEREMLADAMADEIRALHKLGKQYGIKVLAAMSIGKWEAR